MARMVMIPKAEMTDDQRAACDEASSGLRGAVPTPMIAWIRNSELARRAQRLGELLEDRSGLDALIVQEAAVLATKADVREEIVETVVAEALDLLEEGLVELALELAECSVKCLRLFGGQLRHQVLLDGLVRSGLGTPAVGLDGLPELWFCHRCRY